MTCFSPHGTHNCLVFHSNNHSSYFCKGVIFMSCRKCSVFLGFKLKDTLFKHPELDRKLTCAHSFGLRVLTGLTHIFGLRQKSRQEADPSSSLAASTSSLPLPNLQIRRTLTINIQSSIKMHVVVACRGQQ